MNRTAAQLLGLAPPERRQPGRAAATAHVGRPQVQLPLLRPVKRQRHSSTADGTGLRIGCTEVIRLKTAYTVLTRFFSARLTVYKYSI